MRFRRRRLITENTRAALILISDIASRFAESTDPSVRSAIVHPTNISDAAVSRTSSIRVNCRRLTGAEELSELSELLIVTTCLP